MDKFAAALEALNDSRNEPINWLLGDVLRAHAGRADSHFLLQLLEDEKSPARITWNAHIHQFRKFLRNPEDAPRKAANDLKPAKDAEERLIAFAAEIMAVNHLHSLGYDKFEIVPSEATEPVPDFKARLGENSVNVEVKNLREPMDIIRTVVARHWRLLRRTHPARYNFRVSVRHAHDGSLTKTAIKRLCTLLDELPQRKQSTIDEMLDGGVRVRIQRHSEVDAAPSEDDVVHRFNEHASNSIAVIRPITTEDFLIGPEEAQSLLLKAFKQVSAALPKFFGESLDPRTLNVVALRWEPPQPMVAPTVLTRVADSIESVFSNCDLSLRPIIFLDPEVPLDLMKRYRGY